MTRRTAVCSVLICVTFGMAASAARGQGQSPSAPAPVGTALQSEIQCGPSASALEPYDAKITLLQVVRGAQAWQRLKEADAANRPPQAGFDYILARIGFELKARGAPANKTFELARPFQFTAISPEGKEYKAPAVTLPKPELKRVLRSGDSAEGWIVFSVEQGDGKPLLSFDPASGGAMLRGTVLWFQLYQ